MELRHYQSAGLDSIRQFYARGIKKVLLYLATGGGKTLMFCEVLKGVQLKGKCALFVVRGKDLVEQASQRLTREGVQHGVMQGNHWNFQPHQPIQVCSIDTLYARRHRRAPPPADLVVIDEAHFASSQSFLWLVQHYPDAFFLPVTATPHVKTGLRHIADEVVYPISIAELIEQKFLSPPKYYAPTSPNLANVSIDSKTGDYKNAELGCVMSTSRIFGDMVSSYRRLANDRPAVCFAVHCEHSLALTAMFNEAGIAAEHIEANTSPSERKGVLERLENGTTKIVCNVGILCVGVDMPYLGAVILARPTKSYNLFIQQVGRGTRIYPGKENFIVIDHANNLEDHGLIEYELPCNLDGLPKRIAERRPTMCERCFFFYETEIGDPHICPECGHQNTKKEIEKVSDTNADAKIVMAEVVDKKAFMEKRAKQKQIERWVDSANNRGYKPGWVFHKIKGKYGEDEAKKQWKDIKQSVDKSTRRVDVEGDLGVEFDAEGSLLAKPNWGGVS